MHIMHVLRGIVWEVADSGERVIIGRYYPPQPTLWQKNANVLEIEKYSL